MTYLRIEADTSISLDIEFKGGQFLLRLDGGRWQLTQDGGVLADLGHARTDSLKALAKALRFIEGARS